MVSKKNKRKIVYEGTNYYWYVRINEHGHRVRITDEIPEMLIKWVFPGLFMLFGSKIALIILITNS